MKGKKAKRAVTKPFANKTPTLKRSFLKSITQAKEKAIELSLHGWGFELEYIPVSKKAFERLTVDGVTSGEEFDKYMHGAMVHTGAWNGHCSLYLADKKLGKTIRLKPTEARDRIGGNAKYLLVSVSEVKGDIRSIEIDVDFDKNQTTFDLARYELSDGTTFDLVWLDYGSSEDYQCDISCKSIESFVLTIDGKRHPIVFNEE